MARASTSAGVGDTLGRLALPRDHRARADKPESSAPTALTPVRLVEHRVAPLVV